MQQKRLLLALILSSAILFLWSYFSPVPPPTKQNPAATSSPTASATASQAATSSTPVPAVPAPTPNVNAAPQRTLTVRTPLYDAKFDTLGAEPVSWIIKKNKNSQAEIYSVAGHKRDKVPLELISPEGLKRQPRMAPFQLQTGDSALDAVLS